MPHYHVVTGKLAAAGVGRVMDRLSRTSDITCDVEVLPITVAALMTTDWIARHMGSVANHTDEVLLPGYCRGDLQPVVQRANKPVRRGPKDFRELPEFLGQVGRPFEGYGAHDIEILAEINDAGSLPSQAVLEQAARLRAAGADVIDVGCVPGQTWAAVGECVRQLRHAGHRVSVDSWNRDEVEAAVAAGAELVLSVNASNREAAVDWGCEVVAIPDDPHTGAGLDETVEWLGQKNVAFRVDPILEPLGCGFAQSLGRYLDIRRRYPDVPMMMGIGNITELTAVDSAGVNLLLIGLCQELRIQSVLTTQVIPWAQTSVRECDVARRMMHYAVTQGTLPKHLPEHLVMLRDGQVLEPDEEELVELSQQLRDRNIRLAVRDGQFHLMRRGAHLRATDPFALLAQFQEQFPGELDASHAFYLGYELAKAATTVTLGKGYRQDEALRWGILTSEEISHRGSDRTGGSDRSLDRSSGSVDAGDA